MKLICYTLQTHTTVHRHDEYVHDITYSSHCVAIAGEYRG